MNASYLVNGLAVAVVVIVGLAIGTVLFGCLATIGWPPLPAFVPAVICTWSWISVARCDYLEVVSRGGFRQEIPFSAAQRSLFKVAMLRGLVLSISVISFAVVIALGLPGDRNSAPLLFRTFGERILAGGEATIRGVVSAVLAALAAYFVGGAANWGLRYLVVGDEVASVFQRGRRLFSFAEAKARADRARDPSDPGIPWGGISLPSVAAGLQFLIVGATGSGKSSLLLPLYQAILRGITPGSDQRAIIYDGKADLLGQLHGMAGPSRCRIRSFNASDRRSCGWNIAADCNAPVYAWQIAAGFFPEESGPNRYFLDAARGLCVGVIVSFIINSPGVWTLRDIILALYSPEYLRQILSRAPETRHLLAYLAEPRTFQNVLSGILSRIGPFEPIASAWFYAHEQFSLHEFVSSESVLVLSTDESLRLPQDAINRLILKRFTEIHLSLGKSQTRRTWSLWDEARDAKKIDCFSTALTKGRSSGLVTVLGIQDIEGLQDLYGDHVANEMLGQCGIKAILRLESPRTAEWASKLIGECEQLEYPRGNLTGGNLNSDCYSEQRVKREVMLPAEFLTMPPAGTATGVPGVFISPYTGAYRTTLDWKELLAHVEKQNPNVRDVESRPIEQQYLPPWSDEDLARLRLYRVDSESLT